MFKWEDILIVGDSFVSARRSSETDWPKILASKLIDSFKGQDPKGEGFSGCSWWSMRRYLLEQLKTEKPKLLIATHTEPMRIPSDDDLALNSMTVENDSWFKIANPLSSDNVKHAARAYFKYLQSLDFHLWAQKQWFLELDNLIDELRIPYVIHLHCFLPWHDGLLHEFRNGITFDTPLWELSDDIKQWGADNRNHFSVDNNIKLANALYEAIKTYSVGRRNLVL